MAKAGDFVLGALLGLVILATSAVSRNATLAATEAANVTVAATEAANVTVAATQAANVTVAPTEAANVTVAPTEAVNVTVAATEAANVTVAAATEAANVTVAAATEAANVTVAATEAANVTVAATEAIPSVFLPKGPALYTGPDCTSIETCVECLCGAESNEGMRGCGKAPIAADEQCPKGCARRLPGGEAGAKAGAKAAVQSPCLCGPYQISENYFNQCKTGKYILPLNQFAKCSKDSKCASKCVANYLHMFKDSCFKQAKQLKCVDYFRLHRGGPKDCTNAKGKAIFNYAKSEQGLRGCCSTPALDCQTEQACLGYMCGLESMEEGVFGCGDEFGGGAKCGTAKILPNCAKGKRGSPCKCGVYHITPQYFKDCSTAPFKVPIKTLDQCSVDHTCATTCVRNYISRHTLACTGKADPADLTCYERGLIHRAGPNCKTSRRGKRVPERLSSAKKFAAKLTKQCAKGIDVSQLPVKNVMVEL